MTDAPAPPRNAVAAPGIVPVLPSRVGWPLHDSADSRTIERAASAGLPAHALMQNAGLSVARLALAIAPLARQVWVAAGPGNNGGDGLVAARHLHQRGHRVAVSLFADPATLPPDAAHALAQARDAGVAIGRERPPDLRPDLVIDAVLGLGIRNAPRPELALAIAAVNQTGATVLAVDLPSGLHADSGQWFTEPAVRADHCLSLLTLKPGLFTGQGRDHAGRVWLDTLGVDLAVCSPSAWLSGPETWSALRPVRRHAQHKGSFGDVLVIGGAAGMGGAALLAARAALHAGAGRVYVARLDGTVVAADPIQPELMSRTVAQALMPALLRCATVVCGCGGGEAVRDVLPAVLHHAARLVLDADALNAVAADAGLAQALRARRARALPTVLTPHPLEAARLLGCAAGDVQADRLDRAGALAAQLDCTVVLKGSGTVVASAGELMHVNPTGNARLGSAGTGDVLAGWLAGLWSQLDARQGAAAACATAWLHGRAAEQGDLRSALCAGALITAMAGIDDTNAMPVRSR